MFDTHPNMTSEQLDAEFKRISSRVNTGAAVVVTLSTIASIAATVIVVIAISSWFKK